MRGDGGGLNQEGTQEKWIVLNIFSRYNWQREKEK